MIFFEKIQLNRESSEPLFMQIMQQITAIIEEHYPNTPCKMPSARKLAAALKVDRSTIERAYSQLIKAGFLTQSSPRIIHSVKLDKHHYLKSPPSIGIILPDKMVNLNNDDIQFIMEYFKGICDASTQNNVSLAMLQLPEFSSNLIEKEKFVKNINRNYIGIIHLGEREIKLDSPLHKLMCCNTLPQVVISAETSYSNIYQIIPNEYSGAKKLAAKCKSLRLKNFAMVMPFTGIKPKHSNMYFSYTSFMRGKKLHDFFLKENFYCNEQHHIFNFTTFEELFNNFQEKVSLNCLADIYFCYNDSVADWLLEACKKLNISVPGKLSIVGFDGLVNFQNNNLTTIKLPFYEIGAKAVEVLVNQFNNENTPPKKAITIDTDFIIGKTIGKKSI
jgi:LacI family transcriptional regulator